MNNVLINDNILNGQYFVVGFCLFSEESVRNLIASLYLDLHLDFICTDFCMENALGLLSN